MSVKVSDTNSNNIYKKPSFHKRNDSSDELDVFEAAKYFSGYNETTSITGYHHHHHHHDHQTRQHHQPYRTGRISLDLPMMRDSVISQHALAVADIYDTRQSHLMEKMNIVNKQNNKEKKYKQPSSPGGRLASFLNSLFSQSGSRKKKSSKSSSELMDESPGGRRRRRSSISHFRSSSSIYAATTNATTNLVDSAKTSSLYYSSSSSSINSGFRTPPPYAITPTKSYKDFKSTFSSSDHHHSQKSKHAATNGQVVMDDGKRSKSNACSEQKQRGFVSNRAAEKDKSNWVNKYTSGEKELNKKFINGNADDHHRHDYDDGGESDSSSDLFELPNYDLGIYSSGLPVYETTHMENIKRGAPIPSRAL